MRLVDVGEPVILSVRVCVPDHVVGDDRLRVAVPLRNMVVVK